MGLTLRARHYWSKVEYSEFFHLRPDLEYEKVTVTADRNINYNLFNNNWIKYDLFEVANKIYEKVII